MKRLVIPCGVAAVALCTQATAATFPQVTAFTRVAVEPATWVCDEYGRCWESRNYNSYSDRRRYQYGYGDGDPYGGYGYRPPPPSKWEQKGFCPPGQHKKGNC
jgi:hypothetical protein